jgi:hypothetical protein
MKSSNPFTKEFPGSEVQMKLALENINALQFITDFFRGLKENSFQPYSYKDGWGAGSIETSYQKFVTHFYYFIDENGMKSEALAVVEADLNHTFSTPENYEHMFKNVHDLLAEHLQIPLSATNDEIRECVENTNTKLDVLKAKGEPIVPQEAQKRHLCLNIRNELKGSIVIGDIALNAIIQQRQMQLGKEVLYLDKYFREKWNIKMQNSHSGRNYSVTSDLSSSNGVEPLSQVEIELKGRDGTWDITQDLQNEAINEFCELGELLFQSHHLSKKAPRKFEWILGKEKRQ